MNPKKIVVFQELLSQFPPVAQALGSMEIEPLPVSGGKEAIAKVWDAQPGFVLLDVAMPQLSGIEVCRQIKEGGLFGETRVILVSANPSETIRERAVDTGCDLFVTADAAGEEIVRFLEKSGSAPSGQAGSPGTEVPPPAEPGPALRPRAPRVSLTGPVKVTVAGAVKAGELINLSQSGLLFAFGETLPGGSPVQLAFPDRAGGEVLISASVVRTIPLKESRKGLKYATGVRFDESAEKVLEISALMVRLEEEAVQAASVTPEFVERVVAADVAGLSSILLGTDPGNPFAFLGPLTDYERAAFSEEGARAECVRKMVLLRAKCGVLGVFFHRVRTDPGTFADPFLERVAGVLSQADAVGEESEKYVREAVAAEDEFQRQGLNQAGTRLHEAKTRLMEKLAEGLTPKGLTSGRKILDDIRARVDALRARPTAAASGVKFDRRSQKNAAEPVKEKAVDRRPQIRRLATLAGVAVLLVGGYFAFDFFSSHISPSELKISLPVERVVREEVGLVLRVRVKDWDALQGKARTEMFAGLEAYMKLKKVRQAKIMDETDRLLAAVTAGSMGLESTMGIRVFRE